MSRRGSTLHEVAKHAGVSIATVSRVVRNIDRVSESTRTKVLEAIDQLDYRPNHFGRALATRRHDTLGFIVPGLTGPYFAEVVHGCTEACAEVRKSVLVFSTHLLPDLDDQLLSMTDRVDGLAICGGTLQQDTLRRLRDTGIPILLVSQPPELDIPTVRVDNISETRNMVRHLVEEHGYRSFAFIGAIAGSPDALDRWTALVDTLTEFGIEPPAEPIPVGFTLDAGNDVVDILTSQSSLPEVLVCGNDELAIGTIGALKSRGIHVPDDIAVTGWDDINIAAHANPSLTTVRQFTRTLGRRAGEVLLALIDDDDVQPDEVLPSELVIRDSCGCTPVIPASFTALNPRTNLI